MLKSTCVPSGLCAERVFFTGRGGGQEKITLSDIKESTQIFWIVHSQFEYEMQLNLCFSDDLFMEGTG